MLEERITITTKGGQKPRPQVKDQNKAAIEAQFAII